MSATAIPASHSSSPTGPILAERAPLYVHHTRPLAALAAALLVVATGGVAGATADGDAAAAHRAIGGGGVAGSTVTGVTVAATSQATGNGVLTDLAETIERVDAFLETLLDLVRTLSQLFGGGGETGD